MASGDSNELYYEAQRRFVSLLLSEYTTNDEITLSLENISEEDFEDQNLELIFTACSDVASTDSPVTPHTVATRLEQEGNLEAAGGLSFIKRISDESFDYALEGRVEDYAFILKDYSVKNKTLKELQQMAGNLKLDSGYSATDAISEIQSLMGDRLTEVNTGSGLTRVSDLKDTYLEKLDELAATPEGIQGIPTLLPTLDKDTGGFKPGQLVVVGAQTSVGKSIFGVNCAVSAGMANKSVLLFSLEMKSEEVERRIVSSISKVPLNDLKDGRVTDVQREAVKDALEQLHTMKISIDAQLSTTIGAIKAKAKKQAQSKEGLDFIIVDYLGLIGSEGLKTKTEREQLEEISRILKLLAVDLKVPIMLIVQLTRPSSPEEADALPTKYQIRGSGGIANDSDVIILLHRNRGTDGETPYTKVIIDKNRDGQAGRIISCFSNLECSIFLEVKRDAQLDEEFDSSAPLDEDGGDLNPWGDLDDDDSDDMDNWLDVEID